MPSGAFAPTGSPMYSIGSLVALALADDDVARHVDGLEGVPHGVYSGLVGGLGVALTHGAGGSDGRLLNHVDKIAQQVSFNADWRGGEGRSAHSVAVPILANNRLYLLECLRRLLKGSQWSGLGICATLPPIWA